MVELKCLVERSRAGDLEAFTEVVRRFQDMAHGYAYSILGDFHLAEDAAQEAFVDAYQKLHALREPAAFPGWFRRIVFKHCDRAMRKRRVPTAPLEEGMRVAEPNRDRSELQERVLEAVRDLPERQREATTLYYINGYSQKEISDFLEVPVTTVKKRLHDSRKRLKERMIGMVNETLKGNALPEEFAQETIGKVVREAQRLNKADQHEQAEDLLRGALDKVPGQPRMLRELNRSIMHGRVYGQSRWDYLPELVEHGRAILAADVEDEELCREVARTLLAIPNMAEAAKFLEGWNAKQGPGLERTAMLAWAKACMADYAGAKRTWQEILALTPDAAPGEARDCVPKGCWTMVDALMAADERRLAQEIARTTWPVCREQIDLPTPNHLGCLWPLIFNWVELREECAEVARECIEILRKDGEPGLRLQLDTTCYSTWFETPERATAQWLDWLRECAAAADGQLLGDGAYAVFSNWRFAQPAEAKRQLADATDEALEAIDAAEAESLRGQLDDLRFIHLPGDYLRSGDNAAARALIEEGIASGYTEGSHLLYELVIREGAPSPPELLERLSQVPEDEIEDVHYWGTYHLAREAAADGDSETAFGMLRRAAGLWCNGPLQYIQNWEQDTRWGSLLEHPEFKAILDERRKRIGPVHGMLHYFPGW